ncbi:MAG: family 10 glycosylhydrolase [Bacteroidota bacterium]|nr:family 10 glycosylhydrolase [Bacteroidota bacterium]
MKNKYLILLLLCLMVVPLSAMPPKHEIRGAWLTTIWRLDWPSTLAKDSVSTEKQKSDLLKILDRLQFLNFNAVFLQVRLRNDVIYPSKYDAWTQMLTGKSGKSPGYDPLKFAIEECHRRGLECHAWMVVVPIGSDRQVRELGENSLVKKRPELCRKIGDEWFLDPGRPETTDLISGMAAELTRSYDIDGIHLDYIRYPEKGELPDRKTKAIYGDGLNLPNWRRENINRIVFAVYDSVKVLKPWVQVSSSLIGKYNDLTNVSSLGWNGFAKVMQDAKSWLHAGKQDFIVPMMYFKEEVFMPFMSDWKKDACRRPVLGGLALYMLNERDWPMGTIMNELNYTRLINSGGQVYFRTEQLMKNVKSCADSLKLVSYRCPAVFPPMVWQDSIAPASPRELSILQDKNKLLFKWKAEDKEPGVTYNIYMSNRRKIDIDNPENIIGCRLREARFEMEIPDDFLGDLFFCVTASDRCHNESLKSNIVKVRFLR